MNMKFGIKNNLRKGSVILIGIVILLSCTIAIILYACNPAILNGKNSKTSGVSVGCYPPSVYVNDRRYGVSRIGTTFAQFDDDFAYLGEIIECVGSQNLPQKNFQANYEVEGTKIYQYGEDIVAYVSDLDLYVLYENNEQSGDD